MNGILKSLYIVLLAAGLSASAAEPPNALFISLDDMNDWLGCYGGHPDVITPNIDKLAKRGVKFTNAHCVSPICGPSRASVLTGLRPETSGVYHNKGTYIDYVPEAVTFPEHFRANGYRALAAGKVNHNLGEPDPRLWDENGPDCGVLGTPFIGDELHTAMMTPSRVIDRGPLKITLPANGGLSAIDRPNNTWDSFDWAPLDCPETDFPDRQIADWGVEQLGKDHGKPLLLALGFYKPHQPFFVPRKYFDLYDAEKVRLPSTIAGDLYDVPPPGRELATRPWTSGTHKTVTEHGAWREATHAYLATVSFVDALVGRVIEALDKGPHADSTWIILWSDHGWSLGEKEHWGKHVPWREGVRMPLIVVPPKNSRLHGCEPGSRCDAPVSLLDLYPTLIDACGLPGRDELEGRSLTPLMANVDTPWNETVVSTVGRGTHSVSNGDWRYIRYFDGSEELYDLKQDPREWFNLASKTEHTDRMRQLARDLPEDEGFERFVGWGRWKCVFPVEGDPMLFDYQGDFGISEQTDVAAENPEVLIQIQKFLAKNKITDRRVKMPLDEKTGEVVAKATAEFVTISKAAVDLETLAHISDEKRRVLGAMTIALDRSVGYVLDEVHKQGITNNTVVVFTNDNGAATYIKTNNGGLRGRKGTVWEGGLRVPFCMSWPGRIPKGTECRAPVNLLDVGYTFCRLAGHTDESLRRKDLDGGNLLDILQEGTESRELFWRRGNTAAVRSGDWKLITLQQRPAFLFDVKVDPKETRNLLEDEPIRVAKLNALLSAWDESLPEPRWRKKASDSYDQSLLKYWNKN